MAAKTEGRKVADVVKSERDMYGSREDVLVDASQTLVVGAVCRTGAAGRKVLIAASVNDVQTIGITGSPTGNAVLEFTNAAGARVTTDPIAADGNTAAWQAGVDTALGGSICVVSGTAVTAMVFTFSGLDYAGIEQPLIGVDISSATSAEDVTVTHTTVGGAGAGAAADEVQTVTKDAGTAGTYTLTIKDESGDDLTTGDIAFDEANTAAVQAIMDTAFGASQVIAGGTVHTAATYTFSGSLYEGRNQPMIVLDVSSLTGVTSVTYVETTKGGPGGTPEADSICLEAAVIGAVYTTKALFLTNQAIVDVNQLDFGAGNKIDAVAELKKVGIICRSEAPAVPETQV